jgi:putative transposase
MPRIGRAVAAGFPHHVIQRGNNREEVFFDAKDRKKYLALLKKYSVKWESTIISYCLMSNHIHLLTKPKSDESLYKMMQGLTLCYMQYFNRTYQRTGRLWECRYHSCIVVGGSRKEPNMAAVARCRHRSGREKPSINSAEDELIHRSKPVWKLILI